MSRIAKKPLTIKDGVKFYKDESGNIIIEGRKGKMIHQINDFIFVDICDKEVYIRAKNSKLTHKRCKSMIGTTAAILSNCIHGVNVGFEKKLILNGVGYKAKIIDGYLEMSLGYSNLVKYKVPKDISVSVESGTEVTVKGVSKEQVGQVAADIKKKRPVEPYKGKGIRYSDENVKLKETKKK